MGRLVLSLTTFSAALLGSLLPIGNTDLMVLAAASASAPEDAIVVIMSAAVADTKSLLYQVGGGAVRLPAGTINMRIERALARARQMKGIGSFTLLASASRGIPPFYFFSIASGALAVGFRRFVLIGLAGRAIRFAGVVALPQIIKATF